MKKYFAILAVIIAAIAIFLLFFKSSLSGTFTISMDGQDYEWNMKSVERAETSDGVIYLTTFAKGDDSIDISFRIWEENGEVRVNCDNPVINLDGNRLAMTRPIRKNDYTLDIALKDFVRITFWFVPYNNNFVLNGTLDLRGENIKLY